MPAAASLSTVRATRAATEDELVAAALPRLDALMAEGVTDGRDQVRLRPGVGDRGAGSCAPPARLGERATGVGGHDLPRRARAAAGGRRRQGRLHRQLVPRDAAGDRRPRAGRRGRRVHARASPSAPEQTARVFEAARAARLAGEAARRPALQPRRRGAGCRASARCRPTTWSTPTRRASPPWPRPGRWPCCCRVPSTSSARRSSRRCELLPQARRADGRCDGQQSRHRRRSRRCCWP